MLSIALVTKHRRELARWAQGEPAPVARVVAAPPPPIAERPLRVLFIGNSLTATNDIPAMVAHLAQAANEQRAFEYQSDTPGGFGFAEHAVSGRLEQHLKPGAWDSVVLQNQGQRAGWWLASQREAENNVPARVIDSMIRAAGAKTVFFMTYARREGDAENEAEDTYDYMQARISAGSTAIARELNAALVPVGTIWQQTYHAYPALRLWAQDGMHPSAAGSYLAACAFYAYFYRASPVGNTYVASLAPGDARAIQQSVADVMLDWVVPAVAAPPPPSGDWPRTPLKSNQPALRPQPPLPPAAEPTHTETTTEPDPDAVRRTQIEHDRAQRAITLRALACRSSCIRRRGAGTAAKRVRTCSKPG